MSDPVDLGRYRAKREAQTEIPPAPAFDSSFSEDSRRVRFHKALIALIDTHADLGGTYLVGELEGASMIASMIPDQK